LESRTLSEKRKLLAAGIKERKSERKLIVDRLKEKELLTVKEISELTGLTPDKVVLHLIALKKSGIVTEEREKEDSYIYKLAKEKVDMSML